MHNTSQPSATKGFTLIEVMIVVAIIAILAAIAYPSYNEYVVKSRRAAGASCLMEMAQFSERYYTTNMSYSGLTTATLPNTACRIETAANYTYGFSVGPTPTAYTLQAVPQGTQATKDTKCGTLSITQIGTKSVTGTSPVTDCF